MKLLKINEIADRHRVSVRTIERLVDAGEFPRPVYIGHRRLWPEQLLDDWLATQIDQGGDTVERITVTDVNA